MLPPIFMSHLHFKKFKDQPATALEEFNILKNASQKDLDEITFLASQICKTPIAVIKVINGESLIKSVFGIFRDEVPRDESFWKPVLEQEKILCIKNIKEDDRFPDSIPSEIVFYAGVPLITSQGDQLGVLCVFDRKPGDLNLSQRSALKVLANQILNLVDYQKQNNELRRIQKHLKQRYNDLEKFASVVSHDLKSPLANIISLTELLKEENQDNISEDTRQYLDFLSQASYSLRSYVDGLLLFYRSEKVLEKKEEDVELSDFFKSIVKLYEVGQNVKITYPQAGTLHQVNKAALTQIFLNLISNALKYNVKDQRRVDISFSETPTHYEFEVKDNGNGIPEADHEKIFDLFTTLDHNDRDGNLGSGIGLATVKKLLHHMDGEIVLESVPGEGSNFKFKIKR